MTFLAGEWVGVVRVKALTSDAGVVNAGTLALASNSILEVGSGSFTGNIGGGNSTVRKTGTALDRLTLSGPDFAAGTGRTQKIVWRRAT